MCEIHYFTTSIDLLCTLIHFSVVRTWCKITGSKGGHANTEDQLHCLREQYHVTTILKLNDNQSQRYEGNYLAVTCTVKNRDHVFLPGTRLYRLKAIRNLLVH